jgi:hypothetical protein
MGLWGICHSIRFTIYTGGYLTGDGTGVEAIGGNTGVKGSGLRGGEFTGTGTGVVGAGGTTGGKFTGTRTAIEAILQTATNTNAFPQYGISSRVINTANTDQCLVYPVMWMEKML